jgi:predicted DNA binding CopG/RHH family protein
MKKALKVPKFKNEDEEREYWSKLDLSEYFESKDFRPVFFQDLKPTSQPISLRLPKFQIARLKEKANFLSVPYQALIKTAIDTYLLSA